MGMLTFSNWNKPVKKENKAVKPAPKPAKDTTEPAEVVAEPVETAAEPVETTAEPEAESVSGTENAPQAPVEDLFDDGTKPARTRRRGK